MTTPTRGALEHLREHNRQLESLVETVCAVNAGLAEHEVVERLLTCTLGHLDSEGGSILLERPEGGLRIAHAKGIPPEAANRAWIPVGKGIAGRVAATGQPLCCRDIERDRRIRRRNGARYQTKSFISVPMRLEGQMGVLNVHDSRRSSSFERDDLRLVEQIAYHASLALRNARAYGQARERARRDRLTGLIAPEGLWAKLEEEIKRARRYQRPLSLALADVDGMQSYNDRHGTVAGDKALVAIARTLESTCPHHDVVALYGGATFALLMPETDAAGALELAEAVRAAVAACPLGSDAHHVTVSVGVASFPADGRTADELVRTADLRTGRAKVQGRNRVLAA